MSVKLIRNGETCPVSDSALFYDILKLHNLSRPESPLEPASDTPPSGNGVATPPNDDYARASTVSHEPVVEAEPVVEELSTNEDVQSNVFDEAFVNSNMSGGSTSGGATSSSDSRSSGSGTGANPSTLSSLVGDFGVTHDVSTCLRTKSKIDNRF